LDADLGYKRLAQLKIAGGNIRNIALNAALLEKIRHRTGARDREGIEMMSFATFARKPEAKLTATNPQQTLSGLRIGNMNDTSEREADRVANELAVKPMSAQPQGSLSKVTMAATSQTNAAEPTGISLAPSIVHEAVNSSGSPLDIGTQNSFEHRLGYDFSRVRIHTDAKAAESARAINAQAYTVGHHIVFGAGCYEPESLNGRELLAHEFTHVVQQRGRSLVIQRAPAEQPLYWWHMRGAAVLEAKSKLNLYHQQERAAGREGFGNDWRPLEENDFVDDKTPPALGMFQRQRGLRHQDSRLWQETLDALNAATTASPTSSEVQPSKPEPPSDRPIGTSGIGADTGVPWSDRDPLQDPDTDHTADPAYIDNIVHGWYDLLANRFEVDHQDGASIDLDADSIRRVARAGPPLREPIEGKKGGLFFRNRSNGKIYPVHFTSANIPTIVAVWREIEKQTPQSLENLKEALIDVAVAAHGVAQSGIKAGEKFAEAEGAGAAGAKLKPSQLARRQFSKLEPDYAERLAVGPGGVVHHARELQLLDKYPGVFTAEELNDFKNMRGIPAKFNDELHLSGFRKFWNEAYEFLANVIKERKLKPGTPEYNELVRSVVDRYYRRIDDEFGHLFTEFGKVLKK
jgi:hypothetical protein